MNALSEQDADRLLEGVARIAEPLTLEGLREESILVVHSLIPSVSASWNEISATGTIDAVSVPEIDRWPGMDEAFARALAGHPVIAHTRKTNDGRPRAISDFWSIDQFHASTLYQELYRKLSTEDQLSFTVPTPDVLIGVAINRDRRLLGTRPHHRQPVAPAHPPGLPQRGGQRTDRPADEHRGRPQQRPRRQALSS